MRGQPHPGLVHDPAVSFQLSNGFCHAQHLGVPTIAWRVGIRFIAQVLKKSSANARVQMPCVFLPEELVTKLLPVFVWRMLHCAIDLVQRQNVVTYIRRQHGRPAPIFWQHLRPGVGISSDIQLRQCSIRCILATRNRTHPDITREQATEVSFNIGQHVFLQIDRHHVG